jgi:hypothetical protein
MVTHTLPESIAERLSSEAAALLTNVRDAESLAHLAAAITAGPAQALGGAGCRARIGYPVWTGLLDMMHDRLDAESGREQRVPKSLREYKDDLWRAEEYKRLLGSDYNRVLVKIFADPRQPDQCLCDIVRLPFRHVFTTNYESSLERAHESVFPGAAQYVNWSDDEKVLEFLFRFFDETTYGRRYVYLHGRHDRIESIVLTDADYTRRYVRSDGAARRLFAIFALQRVVFFGFSMNDVDLMTIMRQVNVTVGYQEARHFAFIGIRPDEDREVHRTRLFQKFGVRAILYDSSENHAQLGVLTRALTEVCCEGPAPGAASAPTQETSRAPDATADRDATTSRPRLTDQKAASGKADGGEPAKPTDPEDPQKGLFGGLAERGGWRLSAQVETIERDWFAVTLTVESTDPARPLDGQVAFHLHDTFRTPVRHIQARQGKAVESLECYGAFTVGAEVMSDGTRLELDLATLPEAPLRFRMS